MRQARIFAAAVAATLVVPTAQAAELLDFSFENGGINISEVTPWEGVDTFDPGLRPFGSGSSGMVIGPGLVGFGSPDAFVTGQDSANGDTLQSDLAGAIANEDYITFTLQALEGKQLNLSGGNFELNPSGQGGTSGRPDKLFLLTSVEGFTSAAVVDTQENFVPAEVFNFNFPNNPSLYDGLTGPVEFRIYMSRDDGLGGGGIRFDYRDGAPDERFLTVNGTITDVPEPAALSLLGLGAMTLLRRRA